MGWLRPSWAFLIAVFFFIALEIISIHDFLSGLANPQIILIFLLVILTVGIQKNLGKGFFFALFRRSLSPFQFRLRMMLAVSAFSSVLNNTPVVAFMIPYVKSWAEKNQIPPSKFLIPLSFATILGGMITVVGTSTNLVLNGMIIDSGLPSLAFQDFLFPGLMVSIVGVIYLSFASDKLLPDRADSKDKILGDIHEYLVETRVSKDSPLIGKTVEEAGLRHLKNLFLVELKRGDRIIPAVGSERLLQQDDILFFAGNTESILDLINQKNGLELPEESHIHSNGFFSLSEAVIPSGSSLVGSSLKESGFRDKYKSSVISIYRKGKLITEGIGKLELKAGDLLLMLCADEFDKSVSNRDIIPLSKSGELEEDFSFKKNLPSFLAIAALLIGIFGFIDLFFAVLIGIGFMSAFKVFQINEIKNAIDLELLFILISALAIGGAIQKSGTSEFIVQQLELYLQNSSPIFGIIILFMATLALTSLITNAAAVSIMFPIAFQLGLQYGGSLVPYFVTIAFAASADFITPIAYQTNLMVMGPGNYEFSDYFKIGLPLTILYSLVVLSFIHFYYF